MIQRRAIAPCLTVAACLFVIASLTAHAQQPAQNYSDIELKNAGWSVDQIKLLREEYPQSLSTTEKPPSQNAPSEPMPYESVFENYRSFEYLPDTDWKKANDNVGRIGGWRTYTRQVQEEIQRDNEERESNQSDGENK